MAVAGHCLSVSSVSLRAAPGTRRGAAFRGFSYGFRPGRGQHMALDALYVAIKRKRVSWILDLDLKSFFDNISHESWFISSSNESPIREFCA